MHRTVNQDVPQSRTTREPAQRVLMVKIQIKERNVRVSDGERSHLERRLGFALARYGERIARVIVRFSEPGAGQGAGTRCQIHVGLRSRSARAEDTDSDLLAAIDRAADRLSRSVGHILEREQAWDAAAGALTKK